MMMMMMMMIDEEDEDEDVCLCVLLLLYVCGEDEYTMDISTLKALCVLFSVSSPRADR